MIEVVLVPSAVAPGEEARGSFLTTYLVNRSLAIDAGGLGLIGDLAVQAAVTDVFLTHSHMDHIATLPLFLDAVFDGPPVTIHAGAATIESLRGDVFNDRVWPDFLSARIGGRPLARLNVLEPLRPVVVESAGLTVTPVPVDHAVPTLGLLLEAPDGTAVAVPSDTGPTDEFWRQARARPGLGGVFLECSFPDALGIVAQRSKHLTPALFAAELRKLGRTVPTIVVHRKPRHQDEVARELAALGLPGVALGEPSRVYRFGPGEGGLR